MNATHDYALEGAPMSRTNRNVTRGMDTAMASWSAGRHEVNDPNADHEREEILSDLYAFTQYAVRGDTVLVRGLEGRALVTPHPTEVSLIVFTYRRHGENTLRTFWMNRSSVADLSDMVKASGGDTVVDFDLLLANEEVV